jgi:hypothetical protein
MTQKPPAPTSGSGFKKFALASLLVIVMTGSAAFALPPVNFSEIKSH